MLPKSEADDINQSGNTAARNRARRTAINSSAQTASVSLSEELSRLREKREALEQVLSYAHQLTHLQSSIDVVQQMLTPSQAPGRTTSSIADYCKKAAGLETPNLSAMLEKLDKALASDIEVIVALSQPGTKATVARREQYGKHLDTFAALKAKLADFRRNGEMNVAIRYVLYERGVQLEAARLPISQNDVADRLNTVRDEEQHCRVRLKTDMETMVADIRRIMAQPGCPDPLKQRMSIARDRLEIN